MKNNANQVKFTISLAIVFTAIVFNASQATGQFYEEYTLETHMPVITSYEIIVHEEAAPSYDPYDLVALESSQETEIVIPAENSSTSVEVVQSAAVQTPATSPMADPIPVNSVPAIAIPFTQPQAMPVQMEVPVQMPMPMQVPFGGHMPMTCSGGT